MQPFQLKLNLPTRVSILGYLIHLKAKVKVKKTDPYLPLIEKQLQTYQSSGRKLYFVLPTTHSKPSPKLLVLVEANCKNLNLWFFLLLQLLSSALAFPTFGFSLLIINSPKNIWMQKYQNQIIIV